MNHGLKSIIMKKKISLGNMILTSFFDNKLMKNSLPIGKFNLFKNSFIFFLCKVISSDLNICITTSLIGSLIFFLYFRHFFFLFFFTVFAFKLRSFILSKIILLVTFLLPFLSLFSVRIKGLSGFYSYSSSVK